MTEIQKICMLGDNNNNNNNDRPYFIDNILTIKILFTINSLKKTILSKHYLQFLSFKKIPLSFDWEKKSFH